MSRGRQEFSFIHPPVTGEDGWPRDEGGVVPDSPGLYFMGLLFQRGFYSTLIGGGGRDANHIARHIVTRTRSTAGSVPAVQAVPAQVRLSRGGDPVVPGDSTARRAHR